jgi:hypothetical protein
MAAMARCMAVFLVACVACAGAPTSPHAERGEAAASAGAASPTHNVRGGDPTDPEAPRRLRGTATGSPDETSSLLAWLDTLSLDAARTRLQDRLTEEELHHVGFEQVSVAQCIDRLLDALESQRQQPNAPGARGELRDAAHDYLAAQEEALVRRTAGAASCLPPLR